MLIYRYIPLKHLRDLLQRNQLFFNNVLNWEDPYENFMIKQDIITTSGEKIGFDFICPSYYGQCWTKLKESDAMWRIYSVKMKDLAMPETNLDEVAVKICIDTNSLEKEIHKFDSNVIFKNGEVEYTDQDEILSAINNIKHMAGYRIQELFMKSLFVKRKAFKHEDEYRFVIQISKRNNKHNENKLLIPFDISLINEYVIDPRLPTNLYNQIKTELLRLGVEKEKISKSRLYQQIKRHTIIVNEFGAIDKIVN